MLEMIGLILQEIEACLIAFLQLNLAKLINEVSI
jgi:hypothetical protein